MLEKVRYNWFSNIRADVLSGIVVALALIPEAIAFSIIAGVDPMVGLYASFTMAVVIAFAGGRPGMISAATGAMALVMVPLVRDYGLEYLFAATILTGLIQVLFGIFKVAKLMKFIPRAVMIGFVNSLAILVFMAQIPHVIGGNVMTYVFLAVTLCIVCFVPKFFRAIPAPLIAVILLTAAAILGGIEMKTVGDLGSITQSLPSFLIPDVPFTFETLAIIFPFSLSLAIVGLMESLLTSSILDDMTGTGSNKNQEAKGQGIANIVTGFFGGMAGCAMIGQSVINVRSGGRSRLSTLVAGMFLMFLILILGDLVVQIPMPVLAGIMFVVAFSTFDWSSFSYLKKAPRSDALVMFVTVIVVVTTHDLSKGVLAGVFLSMIIFAVKVSAIKVTQQAEADVITYTVHGQLFFASVDSFIESFEFDTENKNIIIDFSFSHIWDSSAVGAIDKVLLKYAEKQNKVTVTNLNATSKKLVEQVGVVETTSL